MSYFKTSQTADWLIIHRKKSDHIYRKSRPLSLDSVNILTLTWGGGSLMAGAISVSRNPIIGRKHFMNE